MFAEVKSEYFNNNDNNSTKEFLERNSSSRILCNSNPESKVALCKLENDLKPLAPKWRQTKICWRKRPKFEESLKHDDDDGDNAKDKENFKTEMFLVPLPKDWDAKKSNSRKSKLNSSDVAPKIPKTIKDRIIIMGNVDFCLKNHNLYPDLNAVWDIYGKLQKKMLGKQASEFILLLRNLDGKGPILQAIYHDSKNQLPQISVGLALRLTGQFIGVNRFRVLNLKPYE